MSKKDSLDLLLEAFEKRKEFWRNCKNDPHGVSMAVYVCMCECVEAVKEVKFDKRKKE